MTVNTEHGGCTDRLTRDLRLLAFFKAGKVESLEYKARRTFVHGCRVMQVLSLMPDRGKVDHCRCVLTAQLADASRAAKTVQRSSALSPYLGRKKTAGLGRAAGHKDQKTGQSNAQWRVFLA